MSLYNGPPRPGARGGRGEFSWDNVKADKDREFYLGHSVKAATGRWQKGKDLNWYAKGKSDMGVTQEELEAVKAREREMMAEALGLKPKSAPSVHTRPALEKHEVERLLKGGADDQEPAAAAAEADRMKGLGFASKAAVAVREAVHEVMPGTVPAGAPAGGVGRLLTLEQLAAMDKASGGAAGSRGADKSHKAKKSTKEKKHKKEKKEKKEKTRKRSRSPDSTSSSGGSGDRGRGGHKQSRHHEQQRAPAEHRLAEPSDRHRYRRGSPDRHIAGGDSRRADAAGRAPLRRGDSGREQQQQQQQWDDRGRQRASSRERGAEQQQGSRQHGERGRSRDRDRDGSGMHAPRAGDEYYRGYQRERGGAAEAYAGSRGRQHTSRSRGRPRSRSRSVDRKHRSGGR